MQREMALLHKKTTAKPEEGGLNWDAVLATGTLLPVLEPPMSPPQLQEATKRLEAFAAFCDLACEHMITLVTQVSKARAGVVSELVAETRVVVATMDAYCKYQAGRLRA